MSTDLDGQWQMTSSANQPGAPFDSALARRLGADRIGMKVYVMAFLKKGPNRNQDSVEAAKLQAAHLAHIGRMAEEGSLVLAGRLVMELHPWYGSAALMEVNRIHNTLQRP
jgi:hypothetical protein